ncbi:MAG: DUF2817 domain-containing protein [Dethiosulfatibacter sp.]|nr:DUF2817 domain-containing protein [Dethiosulfatibacter sp.]
MLSYDNKRKLIAYKIEELREHYFIECHQKIYGVDEITDRYTIHANKERKKMLVLSTGLHGIEGFIGSDLVYLFLNELIDGMDTNHTEIRIYHCLNPWAMKHNRRVNSNNVDLNRTFGVGKAKFENDDYIKHYDFFKPYAISNYGLASLKFYVKLIRFILGAGTSGVRAASLKGQSEKPEGIYYSGNGIQTETDYLMKEIDELMDIPLDQLTWIDLHSGYGPRDQMTILNSPQDKRPLSFWKNKLDYPRILQATADEFYEINGDMMDYMYRKYYEKRSATDFYGTCFEFGTYGDSMTDQIRSLKTMIFENNLAHKKCSIKADKKIRRDFQELYYPTEKKWQDKAREDFKQAIIAIIGGESNE